MELPASLPEVGNQTKGPNIFQESNLGQSSYSNKLTNEQNPATTIEQVVVKYTTHNGIPAVIFKSEDYYGIMAEDCRRTIVGRFLKTRPQIERIRSKVSELFALKGSVKVGVYDTFNVFLDFTNQEDFNLVWYKRVVEIHGLQMWLQKWSPDFKPEEDSPIVPVWALLPGLPFHMHSWQCVKEIVEQVGTPLTLDMATKNRTRPSMAKVLIEIDLLKSLPSAIWVGLEDDDSPLRGFEQKIEFENVPKYCKQCKKIGHDVYNCRVVERMRATEKRKQQETARERDREPVNDENWDQTCNLVERLKPKIMEKKLITWVKPTQGVCKLNTDGSFIRASGRAGIGGLLRDDSGNLIMAFSRVAAGSENNNMAEALAALVGLQWCKEHCFRRIELEMDSMLVVKMIQERSCCNNVKLKEIIHLILEATGTMEVEVKHCYREGNAVADCLAKRASMKNETRFYSTSQNLPRDVQIAYHFDNAIATFN